MTVRDWTDISNRTLAVVDQLTDQQMREVMSGLDASFKSIERDIARLHRKLETRQRDNELDRRYIQTQLVRLRKVNMARQLLSPELANQFEAAMLESLKLVTEQGVKYSDLMTQALSNPPELVEQFGDVNIEAMVEIARNSRQRLIKHSETAANYIVNKTSSLILQGAPLKILMAAIQGQLNLTKARAENIARTETLSAFNSAATKRYKDYGARYVQILALVDRRTTPWCRGRHMRIIKITDSQPPYHFQCRTVTAPVDPAWLEADDLKWMKDEMAIAKQSGPQSLGPSLFEVMNKIPKPSLMTPTKFETEVEPEPSADNK